MNQTFGCSKCSQTFNSKDGLIAHMKNHAVQVAKPVETAEKPTVQQVKPKEIRLTYVYQGQCDTCGQNISTIELDVTQKHYCIAFCPRCNKQLATREVEKL